MEELRTTTHTDASQPSQQKEQPPAPRPEVEEAWRRVENARQQLLTAAIAYCDGLISEGQLRAVRELLRERENRLTEMGATEPPRPFVEPEPAPQPKPEPVAEAEPPKSPLSIIKERIPASIPADASEELKAKIRSLDRKLLNLEEDFKHGRVNASQYRAIRRHYLEQREVALTLHRTNPKSDRWRVVLEEGKTTFLLQLNEAECRGFALYDVAHRQRIFVHGAVPPSAEEAMSLLRTFDPGEPGGRMFATQADDGSALFLIPGKHTAALVVFSEDPPDWQVRALREVHRNFETANRAALARGAREGLVFPDLTRFIKSH